MPRNLITILNKIYPEIVCKAKHPATNKIALTFDDVPYQNSKMKAILDHLNKFNFKATFFLIADPKNITPEYRNLLIMAIRDGHQIANHGITNSKHILLSHLALGEEIIQCGNFINQLYQEANVKRINHQKFYRPGSGFCNQRMIDLANNLRHQVVLGNVYPHDPIVHCRYINYLFITKKVVEGDIVILHDRNWTPELLEILLPKLNKMKLTSVTLNELLENCN